MFTRGYDWRDILGSPYFDGATMLAKVMTVLATLIWGYIVLRHDEALLVSHYGQILRDWAPGWVWGTGATSLGLIAAYRIVRRSRPNGLTWIVYGAMMGGWLFVAFFLMQGKMPGAIASAPIIALLSIIAFLASPRRRG